MKITKRQLRKIIREEKARILNEMIPDNQYEDPYMEAMMDLYEDFEAALTKAKAASISHEDVQTAFGDASENTGY